MEVNPRLQNRFTDALEYLGTNQDEEQPFNEDEKASSVYLG